MPNCIGDKDLDSYVIFFFFNHTYKDKGIIKLNMTHKLRLSTINRKYQIKSCIFNS